MIMFGDCRARCITWTTLESEVTGRSKKFVRTQRSKGTDRILVKDLIGRKFWNANAKKQGWSNSENATYIIWSNISKGKVTWRLQLILVLWILSVDPGKQVKKIKSQNPRFLNATNNVTDIFRNGASFSPTKIERNYCYLHHTRQNIHQKTWAISFSVSPQIASVSRHRGVLYRLRQFYRKAPGSRCL